MYEMISNKGKYFCQNLQKIFLKKVWYVVYISDQYHTSDKKPDVR